jgi:hypothetical protein
MTSRPSRPDVLFVLAFPPCWIWQAGVAYVGATAPGLGIFVVDASGPPRAMVGPVAHAYEVFGPLAARYTDETAWTLARRDEPWAAA